jgi:hypothetical protein
MSNTTATNPIICNATGSLLTGPGFIKSIQFTNTGAGASLTLLLTDSAIASGTKKVIQIELTAERPCIPMVFNPSLRFTEGLYCETIDGGEVLIQV